VLLRRGLPLDNGWLSALRVTERADKMKQVTVAVISSKQVMPGTYLIWLESPEIAQSARPGQFVMVYCGEDTVLRRPLSVHRVESDRLALLFAVIGKGTQWLAERESDDGIDVIGSLGNGFSVSADSKNLLLVAGGMGIAPLRLLAEDAIRQGKNVRLLYGTASRDRYPVPAGIADVVVTEDGSVGYRGLVTDLIPEHIDWADQVFACGPLPMYKAMAQMPELKNKPVQVSLETRMGCGRGICYACTVKTKNGLKQVCTDGPVFGLDEIVWEELKD
jgi:dihydroorotate dehydrogenase electron transfer subunit